MRGRMVGTAVVLAMAGGALSGCAGGPGDPVGEWAGTLRTQQGACPDTMPSRLIVGSENVSFVPGGGTLVLKGRRHERDDRLHAQLMLRDASHKPLPMVFNGTLSTDGKTVEGVYGTPSCRATIALSRPENHPIQRLLGG